MPDISETKTLPSGRNSNAHGESKLPSLSISNGRSIALEAALSRARIKPVRITYSFREDAFMVDAFMVDGYLIYDVVPLNYG